MKYILILLMLCGTAYGQTKGYLRYDSVVIMKNGGNGELIIENGSRGVTGGVLTNTGNGRTAFVAAGGSWTPTWQQTLTAGSTLTGNNVVNGGGFQFEIGNSTMNNFSTVNGVNYSYINNNNGYTTIGAAKLNGTPNASSLSVVTDSVNIFPYLGRLTIDTINNETFQNQIIGWTSTAGTNRGRVGYITIGSGLSLAAGELTATGGGGTPGGSDTQVQFNDGGSFGGDSGLVFNKTTNALTVGGNVGTSGGNITIGQPFPTASSVRFYHTDLANTSDWLLLNKQNGQGIAFYNNDNSAYRMLLQDDGAFWLGGSAYPSLGGTIRGTSTGRVGINTDANASAALDVSSTTGGVLMPRMTATQGSAITGVNGLVIYVTDTNGTFTSVGFWGYENGAWVKL